MKQKLPPTPPTHQSPPLVDLSCHFVSFTSCTFRAANHSTHLRCIVLPSPFPPFIPPINLSWLFSPDASKTRENTKNDKPKKLLFILCCTKSAEPNDCLQMWGKINKQQHKQQKSFVLIHIQ